MNQQLSESFGAWQPEFDPYNISADHEWLSNAELTEDILQLRNLHLDRVLDVGYYQDRYRAYVVENADWDHPIDKFESTAASAMAEWVYAAISRYALPENRFIETRK